MIPYAQLHILRQFARDLPQAIFTGSGKLTVGPQRLSLINIHIALL